MKKEHQGCTVCREMDLCEPSPEHLREVDLKRFNWPTWTEIWGKGGLYYICADCLSRVTEKIENELEELKEAQQLTLCFIRDNKRK